MNTVILYDNGAVMASSASNNGAYVAMEDGTVTPGIAHQPSGDINFFGGSIAGGPFGPFFTESELTARNISDLYQLGVEYFLKNHASLEYRRLGRR